MVNIHEFKNKLQGYQRGIDYIYDEGKKTYTIHHEELKKNFWGDASNEVEYKAIEDSRGNIQFRKSVVFRSSKEKKEEIDQAPFVHSVEKMRDKQWQEENLGNFPKEINTSPSNLREPTGFEGVEEEFGYYKQWKGWKEPFEEPTNTVYHRRGEGNNFFERKIIWKDSDSQTSNNLSQIQEAKQIKTENFSNYDKKEQKKENETNQQSSLQINKENNKNIYYGVGLISLVLLVISMVVVRIKKKR